MSENLDLISPVGVGSDAIGITLNTAPETPILVGDVITLDFDYSALYPAGAMLPLILQVQPAFGDGNGYREFFFKKRIPNSYAFHVQSPGRYLAIIRECFHNRSQGRLFVDVGGE